MKITQIRNATVKIEYAGKTFLIDPWLMPAGQLGTFEGQPFKTIKPEHDKIAMPVNPLPFPLEQVLSGIDSFIVTHVHPDHLDMTPEGKPRSMIPKDKPLFVQRSEDAFFFIEAGFQDVTVMYENSQYGGVRLIPTAARHGTKIPCGPACGVLFRAPGEKTLYVAGDTIFYDEVAAVLEKYHPEVIILNACGATLKYFGRLIMDAHDVLAVHKAAPYAKIIISHTDNVAHATIDRAGMRKFVSENKMEKDALIPEDGETLEF